MAHRDGNLAGIIDCLNRIELIGVVFNRGFGFDFKKSAVGF